MPDKTEGCLGDFFYDLFYEIENVVIRGPPEQSISVSVDNSSVPP
jgi:hypothetical protein